jgi:mannose-1-phosphate guanylyltransferase
MSKIIHVLLTGGVGSRLWPLSRKSRPKQYIDLFGGYSLFELAVLRNQALCDQLMVVGNCDNHDHSLSSLSKLRISDSKTRNIVEAAPRNTAAAIAFAAFAASAEDILVVTPADHIIENDKAYQKAIKEAINLAKENNLVTFGVQPDRPETGYGYIEFSGNDVVGFREKPDAKTAEGFLQQGTFLWNSGMFCFKAGTFLEELKKFEPEVYNKALIAWQGADSGKLNLKESMEIPSISVDYAVMERSDKIKVIPADFSWSDMGSFEAIYDHLISNGHKVDDNRNMVIGSDKYTAFVGLRDTIMVCTKDANLLLQKENSQDVKQVFTELESSGPELIN